MILMQPVPTRLEPNPATLPYPELSVCMFSYELSSHPRPMLANVSRRVRCSGHSISLASDAAIHRSQVPSMPPEDGAAASDLPVLARGKYRLPIKF